MSVISDYDRLHETMIQMVKDIKPNAIFYLVSFHFDINFLPEFKQSLDDAISKKNITVKIITCGLGTINPIVDLPNTINNIQNKDHKINPFFRLLKKYIIDCGGGTKYNYGVHMRYCYNGEQLLIGGANISSRYSGTWKEHKGFTFSWYDSGLLVDFPNQNVTFETIYQDLQKGNFDNISVPRPLIICSKAQHDFICEGILSSKKSIYIENQYFFSTPKLTTNTIAECLTRRINRAIKNKESFHVTLLLNDYNFDERHYTQFLVKLIQQESLHYLRESVQFPNEVFNKYCSVYVPNNNHTTIHTKVYCFDRSTLLFTSANIIDRSLVDGYDTEMGIILDHTHQVKSVYKQLYQNFIKLDTRKINDTLSEPLPLNDIIKSMLNRRFLMKLLKICGIRCIE